MTFSDFAWLLLGAPLEKCFYILYTFLYTLTSNYGIALLLLSLVTSCLMLPIEEKVRGISEEEKELQAILSRQLKTIKEQYTGSERHLAIKRLYRRYSYNPFFSIRSAATFFVQLPFLLGAYWMLTNLSSLDGVKFLFIQNLSKPDALLFGFNLLPILMTVINVGTAFAQVSSRRDKLQAIFVASLFLVFLYTANSALLIYWTTNNFIGLCKALYSRFKTHLKTKITRGCSLLSFVNKWAIVFLPVVSIGFISISRSHLCPQKLIAVFGSFAHLINFSLIVLLAYRWLEPQFKRTNIPSNLYKFSSVLFAVFLGLTLIKIIGCLVGNEYRFVYTQSLFCIFVLILLLYFEPIKLFIKSIWKRLPSISITTLMLPVLFLLSLVFLTFPLLLYFSDTGAFLAEPINVVKDQVIAFLGWSLLFLLVLAFLKGKAVSVIFILFAALSLTVVLYISLFSPDLGLFINFKFTEDAKLTKNVWNVAYAACFILSFITILFLALSNKLNLLRRVLFIFLATSIGYATYTCVQYRLHTEQNKKVVNTEISTIPESSQKFLTFSKHGKNILVIMLDAFSGYDMDAILKFDPSLADKFSGFTLYSDTLTTANNTFMGKAPLLGGHAATAGELNKQKGVSLEEKVNRLWDNLFSRLIEKGFEIQIRDNQYYDWLRPKFLSESTRKNLLVDYQNDFFIKDWEKENNYRPISMNRSISHFLTMFGLFKISPNRIGSFIYQNSRWRNLVDSVNPNKERAKNDLANLEGMEKFTRVVNDKKNYFKFYTNKLPHFNWYLNSNCQPVKKYIPTKEEIDKYSRWSAKHQSEYCALLSIAKLIKLLKEEKVYDNTAIFIVSDHGNHSRGHPLPFRWPIEDTLDHLSSLLMYKDFQQLKKPLRIDNESLMSNSDLPELILGTINGFPKNSTPEWKKINRVRPIFIGSWERKHHGKNQMKYRAKYLVKSSSKIIDNWSKSN